MSVNDRVLIFLQAYGICYHIFQPWPHPIVYHHPVWLRHTKHISCCVKEVVFFFYMAGGEKKSQQSLCARGSYRSSPPLRFCLFFFFFNSTYLCWWPARTCLFPATILLCHQAISCFFSRGCTWEEGKAGSFQGYSVSLTGTRGAIGYAAQAYDNSTT